MSDNRNLKTELCATMTTEMVVDKILNDQPEIAREELVKIIASTRGISEQTANTQLSKVARMVRNAVGKKVFVVKATQTPVVKADQATPAQVAQQPQTPVMADDPSAYIPTWNGQEYIPLKGWNGDDVKAIRAIYDNRKDPRALFLLQQGETGCGKTMATTWICHKDGHPLFRVNLNGGTTIEDLVGQFVPTEIPGQQKWVDGILPTAMKIGAWLILDEVNFCPECIASILHPVLDQGRMLVLTGKDGEIVHAHPDFFIVASMNPDYQGTRPLNEAFKNRFISMQYKYNIPAEKKMLKDDGLMEFAKKVRARIKKGEISTPLSTRDLVTFKFVQETIGIETAVASLVDKFQPDERLAVKEALKVYLDVIGTDIAEDVEE